MDNLFSLLDPANLKRALQNQDLSLVRDFARFLSAYYLNLPDIRLSNTNSSGAANLNLPQNVVHNLFVWLDMAENSEFYVDTASESRSKLATLLPHEYTPCTALQLLCQTSNFLEALLFTDNFNDFKSQLILRYLLDQNHNLNLVKDHCHHCLVNGLLNAIDDFGGDDSSQVLSNRIQAIAKVVVQLDVVFNTDLLAGLMQQAVEMMHEELEKLLRHWVDPLIQLPRPPIFATPSDYSEELSELISWNKIFYFLQVLITCLSASNHLHALIARTTLWLSSVNPHLKPELVHFMESEADDQQDATSQQYQNLFDGIVVTVLKVSLRDRICLLRMNVEGQNGGLDSENSGTSSELGHLESKYSALVEKELEEEGENEMLHRWLEKWADDTDVDFLLTFLRYLLENNPRIERYLPPLTTQTHQQWNSILMAQVAPNHKTTARNSSLFTSSLISDKNKIKISSKEWLKLQFLAQQLPFVPLFDPTLVQIALRLEPRDYALPVEDDLAGHITHFSQGIPEVAKPLRNESKPLPITNTTKKSDLLSEIQASINRLASMQPSTVPENNPLDHQKSAFDTLMQDFQLHKLQQEIAEETAFLKEHHIDPQESSKMLDLPVLNELKRLDIQSKLHLLNQKSAKYSSGSRLASPRRSESSVTFSESSALREEIDEIASRLSKIRKEIIAEGTKGRRFSSKRYSTHNPSPVVKKVQTSIPSSESEQKEPPPSTGYYSSDDRSSSAVSVTKQVNKKSQRSSENFSPSKKSVQKSPEFHAATSFRLDFSALDSSPERRKKTLKHKQWTDLEIYPREEEISEVEQPMNPPLTSKTKSSRQAGIQLKETYKYPQWLRLLPDQWEISSKSGRNGPKSEPRLLCLPERAEEMWKEGIIKLKTTSAREKISAQQPEQGMTRYDSGFIDHQTGQSARKMGEINQNADGSVRNADGVLFSCEMSQEQINQLLDEFNGKNVSNY